MSQQMLEQMQVNISDFVGYFGDEKRLLNLKEAGIAIVTRMRKYY